MFFKQSLIFEWVNNKSCKLMCVCIPKNVVLEMLDWVYPYIICCLNILLMKQLADTSVSRRMYRMCTTENVFKSSQASVPRRAQLVSHICQV